MYNYLVDYTLDSLFTRLEALSGSDNSLYCSYTQNKSVYCKNIEMANDLSYQYKASKSVYCVTAEVDYGTK